MQRGQPLLWGAVCPRKSLRSRPAQWWDPAKPEALPRVGISGHLSVILQDDTTQGLPRSLSLPVWGGHLSARPCSS